MRLLADAIDGVIDFGVAVCAKQFAHLGFALNLHPASIGKGPQIEAEALRGRIAVVERQRGVISVVAATGAFPPAAAIKVAVRLVPRACWEKHRWCREFVAWFLQRCPQYIRCLPRSGLAHTQHALTCMFS